MFTFKLMKGTTTSACSSSSNGSGNVLEITQKRQDEAMSQVCHVVKRAMVFNAHDRTSRVASTASRMARVELEKGAEEIRN